MGLNARYSARFVDCLALLTGPAVNIGFGALHTIFSYDSTSRVPDGKLTPPALLVALVRPILTKLQKIEDDFKKIFSSLDAMEKKPQRQNQGGHGENSVRAG